MPSTTWLMFSRGQWPFQHHEVDQACDRTAARLEQSGCMWLVGFFAALTARFARWTVDLPASERHHHAFPFGLLIHSIETVERAIAVGMETLNPNTSRISGLRKHPPIGR